MGARAGLPWTLDLLFISEGTGLLTNPDAVELHITRDGEFGFVPDFAGPFTWMGATSPVTGQIWRSGTGQLHFTWPIPSDAPAGAYVANWLATLGDTTFFGTENFYVAGGFGPPVPSGDVGYWTGAIDYTPAPGNLTQLVPVAVDFGAVDELGICWLLNKVEGWDGPDVQGGGVLGKSADHGGLAGPQFYAPRNLTLTVTALAPTQVLRDEARGILEQAVPISDLALFRYDEPVPKQAMVRRSGKISEAYPDLCAVQFTVGLVAPDPRKYSAQLYSAGPVNAAPSTGIGITFPLTFPLTFPAQPPAGSVEITNPGRFESRPVVTVAGPVAGPSLTNVTTGQTVSFTGLALSDTDVLVVDFSLAQARLNGVYRPADVGSSWWTLPPRSPCTIQLGGDTGPGSTMQIDWRAAWI